MMTVAATTILIVLAVLTIFQLALIIGAPIGRFAWGGRHAVLPLRLRIGSAISVIIYAFIVLLVVNKAGFVHMIGIGNFINIALWIVTVYLALGIGMNAISRSKSERYVMTPTATLLTMCLAIIAAG